MAPSGSPSDNDSPGGPKGVVRLAGGRFRRFHRGRGFFQSSGFQTSFYGSRECRMAPSESALERAAASLV